MPGPIRVRIAEIIYQSGYDVQRNVIASPYRIKDSVNISKEAFEKFKAHSLQELHAPRGGGDEQKEKSLHRDPELKRNLEALKLDLGARPEQIRKAYLEAVKTYHPDKFLNRPPEMVRAAEEKTKQINSAYSILRKKA